MRLGLFIIVLLFNTANLFAQQKPSVEVLTNDWLPYINSEGEAAGPAAQMLEVVFAYTDMDLQWKYLPYSDAQSLLELKQYALSYPYIYNEQRAERFLFSEPLYTATIEFYFNKRFHSKIDTSKVLSDYKLGIVKGYSYGEKFDALLANAETPSESDAEALNKLFSNEIDVLPMAKGVMASLLKTHHAKELKLIEAIKDSSYTGNFGLHVIASKTPQGEALINKINKAILLKKDMQGGFFQPETNTPAPFDSVELLNAEGYPIVIGREINNTNNCAEDKQTQIYFTIPQGTQAQVLNWSNVIHQASPTDRLYRNMVEESYVLILNGPHAGDELCVKNMHINIK